MARKSFKTYKQQTVGEFDVNGTVFHLVPSVPGDVLLDFIAGADVDNPQKMAETVRNLLNAAIVPDELDAWHTFIRDPQNDVSLDLLAEIAGYVSEHLAGSGSGNPKAPSPSPVG